MSLQREPTTQKNVVARLFFRFFLCYAAAVTVALLCRQSGFLLPTVTHAGKGEAILLLLALLAAFLTLAKPYLLALTVVKAFYDLCWFAPLLQATRLTLQRVLACNAAFFYLAFSLLLFALAAARGCLFSVTAQKRDTQLLFSRQFLRFLIEALCFAALSALLYFIWSPLVALFI